jgi:hypothetical protein
MTRATADALLEQLGLRLGLAGLRMDVHGCCRLAFDGRWLLTFALMPGGRLFVYCPVGSPDTTSALESATLLAMLQGSFMGRGAAGATLAVSPDRRACVQRDLPLAELDASRLQSEIEQMLITAETWSARLHVGASAVVPVRTRALSRALA